MKKIKTLLVSAIAFSLTVSLGASASFAAEGDSPLSGLPGGGGSPVIMVKIDNVGPARPHTNISKADMVYVEQVEGGLTRIAALYNSSFPSKVGPVRSARISDLEILRQFDKPGFAYSGANKALLPKIAKEPLVRLGPSLNGSKFSRDSSRRIPHNLMLDLATTVKKAKGLGAAKDIGLTFSQTAPAGGKATSTFKAQWPASSVSGKWTNGGWAIALDNKAQKDKGTGKAVVAQTVVVQLVTQTTSGYGDKFGGKTPLVKTVGSGKAFILRDGQRYDGEWSRPSAGAGTSYTVNGAAMPFDVGQVWVLLVPNDSKGKYSFK
jgi:hypothetical protein